MVHTKKQKNKKKIEKVTFAFIHDMKVIFNTFLQLDNDLLRNRRSMHLVTSCFNSCDEIISYPLDL